MANYEQTYTVAGTSVTPDGYKTFRFSNSSIAQRRNMLSSNGHTEINLVELPKPMDQVHAIVWLLANVRGTKGAVISTRATDKTIKSDTLIEAEELYQKQRGKNAGKVAVAKAPVKRGPGRPRNEEAVAA